LEELPFLRKGWRKDEHYVFRLTALPAYIAFLSAQEQAARVGETANLAQTIDECQHTSAEVYERDLAPMRATTAAPAFLMGTAWDEECLLSRKREELEELERRDGKRRVWVVTADEVAKSNPAYGAFVDREVSRLGRDHPIIKTQYFLESIRGQDRFFTPEQLSCMRGAHMRSSAPASGAVYVGGLDVCGAGETPDELAFSADYVRRRDATVGGVCRLSWYMMRDDDGVEERVPVLELVDMLYLPGRPPMELLNRVSEWFFGRWRCAFVTVDSVGVGDYLGVSLEQRYGKSVVKALRSTAADVSRMGFRLLAAGDTGRLRVFSEERPSEELRELWRQLGYLRREVLPGGRMRWGAPVRKVLVDGAFVEPHDDCARMLAYCLESGYGYEFLSRRSPVEGSKRRFESWYDAAGWE
jgi:hypothetical protein